VRQKGVDQQRGLGNPGVSAGEHGRLSGDGTRQICHEQSDQTQTLPATPSPNGSYVARNMFHHPWIYRVKVEKGGASTIIDKKVAVQD
jgi:hypothetical protein